MQIQFLSLTELQNVSIYICFPRLRRLMLKVDKIIQKKLSEVTRALAEITLKFPKT